MCGFEMLSPAMTYRIPFHVHYNYILVALYSIVRWAFALLANIASQQKTACNASHPCGLGSQCLSDETGLPVDLVFECRHVLCKLTA